MMNRFSLPFFAACLVLLPSCGGAGMSSRRPDPIPSGSAAELDSLEADIEREQANMAASQDPSECRARCRSIESICDASGRICQLVAELGDDTLTVRCTRAEAACSDAQTSEAPCACRSE